MDTLPLQLKHLTISGYRGISNVEGKELRISNLASRNAFIGQNNGGKSTVYRFLLLVSHYLSGLGNTFPYQSSIGQFDPNLYWQQNEQIEPAAVLTFNSPGGNYARVEQPGIGGAIVRENEWRLSIRIRLSGGHQAIFFACPQAWVDATGTWLEVLRTAPQGGEMTYLSASGQYVKHGGREKHPFGEGANTLAPLVKEWANSGRFFDPFRAPFIVVGMLTSVSRTALAS